MQVNEEAQARVRDEALLRERTEESTVFQECIEVSKEQAAPIKLTKAEPAQIILPAKEETSLGGMIKGLFSDIKHSVTEERRQI